MVSRIFKPNRNFYSFKSNWFTERLSHDKVMDLEDLDDPKFDWSKVNQEDIVESYKEKRWGTKNPDSETVLGGLG